MPTAIMACPSCAKTVEYQPESMVGRRVRCPCCAAEFQLVAPKPRAAVRAAQPSTAAPTSNGWLLLLGMGAASLLLLAAAIAIGVVYFLAGKQAPQRVVERQPPSSSAAAPVVEPIADPTEHGGPAVAPSPLRPQSPAPPDTAPSSPAPADPTPPVNAPPRANPPPAAPPPAPPAAPTRPAEQPKPPPPTAPAPARFQRRDRLTEEDLLKQLRDVKELSLETPTDMKTVANLFETAVRDRLHNQPYPGRTLITRLRPDLDGLPLTTGADAQVNKEAGETLQTLSRTMRNVFAASVLPGVPDATPDAAKLRQQVLGAEAQQWLKPEAVPCLLQMLQPEAAPVRQILVEALGRIPGQRATAALAMRAIMDLSPDVREAAVQELRSRDLADARPVLLHGLRYPWAPVIDHAAEALVALGDKEAASDVAPLLDLPDPTLPILVKKGTGEVQAAPELVRVAHLRNCALCHAPSLDRQELVRGAVPIPGKPLPPPVQYYETGELFVHADVTYLRQDFSVTQPVPNSGTWPDHQRFDYMIRLRKPTPVDYDTADKKERPLGDEPREALLFALRGLTGKDAGPTAAAWKEALDKTASAKPTPALTTANDDWRQFHAALQPASEPSLSLAADCLKDKVLTADGDAQTQLIHELVKSDDPSAGTALARTIPSLKDAAQAEARDALVGRLGRLSETNLGYRLSDSDVEIRRAAVAACTRREDKGKSLAAELIPLLTDKDAAVAQAAHGALTAATGQDFGPAPGAAPAAREIARKAWEEWRRTQSPDK